MAINYRQWAVLAASIGLYAANARAQSATNDAWPAAVQRAEENHGLKFVRKIDPNKKPADPACVSVSAFLSHVQKVIGAKETMASYLDKNQRVVRDIPEYITEVAAHTAALIDVEKDLAHIGALPSERQADYFPAVRKLLKNLTLIEGQVEVRGPQVQKNALDDAVEDNSKKCSKIFDLFDSTTFGKDYFDAAVKTFKKHVDSVVGTGNAIQKAADESKLDDLDAKIASYGSALKMLDGDAIELFTDLDARSPQLADEQKHSIADDCARALQNIYIPANPSTETAKKTLEDAVAKTRGDLYPRNGS